MAKKEKPEMISTTAFAERMAVNYRTALNWLRAGLVPGAIEHQLPGGVGNYWEIPVTALEMDKPKPGPKKGSKRASADGEVSTATDAPDDAMPAAVTGKKAGKKAGKKSAKK